MATSGSPTRERITPGLLVAVAGVALFFGWRTLWFLTDDAFISFRYVSNSGLGLGYVWNPPPFLPVEGYTNFLWVVILDAIWRIFEVEPPDSANWISLFFSFMTLHVAARMAWRMPWSDALRPWRPACVGLALTGIVSNRTFITWSSSGLETAMFNFFVIAWTEAALEGAGARARSPLRVSTWAALASLTRPDGLIYAAASVALLAGWACFSRGRARRSAILAFAPFLLIVGHIFWRHSFYGEWLPNTYYAKIGKPWPEAGLRYLASFILEYALWIWLGMALLALARRGRRGGSPAALTSPRSPAPDARQPRSALAAPYERLVVICGTGLHVVYYTFIVGGDHFEWRPFSLFIPLLFVSFLWMSNMAGLGRRTFLGALALFIVCSWAVPWTHWAAARNLTTRAETRVMRTPVAPLWPAPVRWYAARFDGLQDWLISHYICMRQEEHKAYWLLLIEEIPPRREGERVPPDGFPVTAVESPGVVGWSFPHVAVIDLLGLNDWVIARTPPPDAGERYMAHEHAPIREYVDSFDPNVEIDGGQAVIHARQQPLTAEAIEARERLWRSVVVGIRRR